MRSTTRRRPDPVLLAIELWCCIENTGRRLENAVRGRKCPICGDRTRHPEAHIYVNHDPSREKRATL